MESIVQKNFTAYLKATGELSSWIALGSFAIGTAFFFTIKWGFADENIFFFGFLLLCFAVAINFLVLVNLLLLFAAQKEYREYFAIKILILLANIPVAIAYLNLMEIL